jgi:ornithine cyclodeaminase
MSVPDTLVLSAADVHACLDAAGVAATVEATLLALAEGMAEAGPRSFLDMGDGAFIAMPGHLRQRRVAGVKWASTLNRNPARGLPKVRAAILVSDADTGHLTAILDAKEITALRTGALAAVTAKYCARGGAAAAAILGFGAVGKGALHTLIALCALKEVRVFGPRREAVAADAARAAATAGVPVIPTASARDAVAGADIVVTAAGLSADAPFLEDAWIRSGTVVCGLGSYQEIDAALVARADKLVVDDWDASAHRGQFAPLVKAGRLHRADVYAELPEIVSGAKRGRSSERDVVVASLLGRGVLDLAIAADVIEQARRRGLGRSVGIES